MAGLVGQRRSRLITASCFIWLLAGVVPVSGQDTLDVTDLRSRAFDGDADAQFLLGLDYLLVGVVLEEDEDAVRLYRLHAEYGYGITKYLGRRYRYVSPGGAELLEAMAAATGSRRRFRRYAERAKRLYAKDVRWLKEAARWHRLAAEQGLAVAQYYLGLMYEFGLGMSADDEEAVRWFRLAAEQGLAEAQYRLGEEYFSYAEYFGPGERLPADDEEAVRWFRLAAEQGHANAQGVLGLMYFKGRGVSQDHVSAHMWLSLAVEAGREAARAGREAAGLGLHRGLRTDVAKSMTRAQIAVAKGRAREWAKQRANELQAWLASGRQASRR